MSEPPPQQRRQGVNLVVTFCGTRNEYKIRDEKMTLRRTKENCEKILFSSNALERKETFNF